MSTLLIAIIVLLLFLLMLQGFILWVASNIRSDQMTIRTWIAHEVRAKRVVMGAPVENDAFYEWLRAQPRTVEQETDQ